MRNHFFFILVLASLLAFVQKFAEGELPLFSEIERSPASLVIQPLELDNRELESNSLSVR